MEVGHLVPKIIFYQSCRDNNFLKIKIIRAFKSINIALVFRNTSYTSKAVRKTKYGFSVIYYEKENGYITW